MNILSGINSPDDIKKLTKSELNTLASEIREFLVENVSKTGGHLASNLGIVELTLAIHKVFDTTRDRLIFDVGHQSYVHKILTGRKDDFYNLRQLGGISGFSRPSESAHDACVSGHASNSVSVALGMARARSLKNENYSVISVTGDGALTGGMAYEALCDAGHSNEPLIVILNDNGMSITKNVGAMTDYLSRLRVKKKYLRFKSMYRSFIKKAKFFSFVDNIIHKVKNAFKNLILPASFFEDMGFTYLGPADGHDVDYIVYLLEVAKDLKRPVVIHLITKKGKGYEPSEKSPQNYHGVGKFDINKGINTAETAETFSSVFGDTLKELSKENKNICAITAAMMSGVGLAEYATEFPDRFFDVAIAEEHAVAMAAGLSAQGMIPVCAIYSTFLQRAYDQIIHDIAISKQHVVLAVDRAGIVGEDGETHNGVFDVSFLSDVPSMKILAPASFSELRTMLNYAINASGPIAIRYSRGKEKAYTDDSFSSFKDCAILREGTDITLLSYGLLINNVIDAANNAREISCEVIKLNSIKPIDFDSIINSVTKTKKLLVCEDVIMNGSVFERIAAVIAEKHINCDVYALNLGDTFAPHGEQQEVQRLFGIDSKGIYDKIVEVCK